MPSYLTLTGSKPAQLTRPGKPSNAVVFYSGSGYVNVPYSSLLDTLSTFTAEAWILPAGFTNGKNSFFNRHTTYGFRLYIGNSGQLTGSATNSTPTSVFPTGYPLPLAYEWHHVAVSWDATTVRVFMDGLQVGGSALAGPAGTESVALTIGNTSSVGNQAPGSICELRISSVPRYTSAGYQIKRTPFTPDSSTIGLWHMSEGAGTTCYDSSGNNLHGVFAGVSQGLPTWGKGPF